MKKLFIFAVSLMAMVANANGQNRTTDYDSFKDDSLSLVEISYQNGNCKLFNELLHKKNNSYHYLEFGHIIDGEGGYFFMDICPKCKEELKDCGSKIFTKLCTKRSINYVDYIHRRETTNRIQLQIEVLDKYLKKHKGSFEILRRYGSNYDIQRRDIINEWYNKRVD